MKKIILLALVLCALNYSSQIPTAFKKNTNSFTIGYGVPGVFKILLKNDLQKEDSYMKSVASRYGNTFSYTSRGYGPLFFKYDYGIHDKIGLGLVIGYLSAGVTETYSYKRSSYNNQYENHTQSISRDAQSLSIGARFNYHFGDSEKSDPYIGFAAGYNYAFITTSFDTDDPNVPKKASYTDFQPLPLYLGITIGVRRYISKNIGGYFEIGFDKWSFIQAGLAFKLSK